MDTRTLTIFLTSAGFSVLSNLVLSFCPRPSRKLPQIYMFNSMGHSPWKSSLLHLQQPTADPQPAPHNYIPHLPTSPPPISLRYILVSYFYTRLPSSFFPSAFPNKISSQLSCLPCILHALLMSLFLISSPQKYL